VCVCVCVCVGVHEWFLCVCFALNQCVVLVCARARVLDNVKKESHIEVEKEKQRIHMVFFTFLEEA